MLSTLSTKHNLDQGRSSILNEVVISGERRAVLLGEIAALFQEASSSVSQIRAASPTRHGSTPRRAKSPTSGRNKSFVIDLSSAVGEQQAKNQAVELRRLQEQVDSRRHRCRELKRRVLELSALIDSLQKHTRMNTRANLNIEVISNGVAHCIPPAVNRVEALKRQLQQVTSTEWDEATQTSLSSDLTAAIRTRDALRDRVTTLRKRVDTSRTHQLNAESANTPPLVPPLTIEGARTEVSDSDSEMESDQGAMEEEISRLKAKKIELLKKANQRRQHGQRIRSQSPPGRDGGEGDPSAGVDMEQMLITMSLIKATIVHFNQSDLKRVGPISRMSPSDMEQRFKEAHNEVKLNLAFVLPREEAKLFAKGLDSTWPVTPQMIVDSFPEHCVAVVHKALQEMIIAWDGMPMASKQRLTTAKDVVSNADLLFFLSRHLSDRRNERRMQSLKRGNVEMSSPKLSQHDTPSSPPATGPTSSFRRSDSSLSPGSPRSARPSSASPSTRSSFRMEKSASSLRPHASDM